MHSFPGHFRGSAHCLLQKHQHEGQCFSEGRLLEFLATGVKQGPKSSGVFVGPLGEGQHDVSAAHHCGMGDKSVIGPTLTLFGKIEKRLGHLEEHLDVPSALIGHDDLLVVQGGVGGQQCQPLFGAPVPDEQDLCRDRDALVVFSDLDHDRGENPCAASSLADLPVDGRQMEVFPLVAIEDLLRDLEHADGMHPFGKQVPHDCGISKPAVEQKMLGLDPARNGLGHRLHKDIGCLADTFPATFRSAVLAAEKRVPETAGWFCGDREASGKFS